MNSMKRFFFFFGLLLIAVGWFSRPFPVPEKFLYGATFSVPYARDTLGLDWKAAYRAMLDDLGVRKVRIPAYWTEYAPVRGGYTFDDLDFLVREAEWRDASVILAIGQKLPRWPECHIPEWASALPAEEKNAAFLEYLTAVITRYRKSPAVQYWQIENEHALFFGECSGYDRHFIDVAVSRARSLDSRPIIITDSGELSVWGPAYSRGDIFGTTLYRHVWNRYIGAFTYPLRPGYFRLKTRLMRWVYGEKPMMVIELQAEPWLEKRPPDVDLEEQLQRMNEARFRDIIRYQQETAIPEAYFWGVEWWYWLKEKQSRPEMWEAARKIFQGKASL